MIDSSDWKHTWELNSQREISDYELDRGMAGDDEIERLSNEELLEFIAPQPFETILDAGCGTGATILLLAPKVSSIIGIDFSDGSISRCQRRIAQTKISNVKLVTGEIHHTPLDNRSIDKVVCLSVLQYVDDDIARRTLKEFARILKQDGTLVLHVKNLSSLYLSALWLLKRAKSLLGLHTVLEYFRSHKWYTRELSATGFDVDAYNSFELISLPAMPKSWTRSLQRLELRNYKRFPFRLALLRRHGAELKIKARLRPDLCKL